MFFVWKGTESIRVLETLAAPILILIGVGMLWWGVSNAGGLTKVLESSNEFSKPTISVVVEGDSLKGTLNVLKNSNGEIRAKEYRSLQLEGASPTSSESEKLSKMDYKAIRSALSFPLDSKGKHLALQFRKGSDVESSVVTVVLEEA